MAVVNAYAAEDEFKNWLLVNGTFENQHTSLLEDHLTVASRTIDGLCGGRQFWLDGSVTTLTYRVRRDGERVGLVDGCEAWVADIGSTSGLIVKTDPGLNFGWSETWTINTDFVLEPLRGRDSSARAWWQIMAVGSKRFVHDPVRATLQVTALHGWSAVPANVKQACLALAGRLEFARRSPGGLASFGDFAVMRLAREDPVVMGLLADYMLPGV